MGWLCGVLCACARVCVVSVTSRACERVREASWRRVELVHARVACTNSHLFNSHIHIIPVRRACARDTYSRSLAPASLERPQSQRARAGGGGRDASGEASRTHAGERPETRETGERRAELGGPERPERESERPNGRAERVALSERDGRETGLGALGPWGRGALCLSVQNSDTTKCVRLWRLGLCARRRLAAARGPPWAVRRVRCGSAPAPPCDE